MTNLPAKYKVCALKGSPVTTQTIFSIQLTRQAFCVKGHHN